MSREREVTVILINIVGIKRDIKITSINKSSNMWSMRLYDKADTLDIKELYNLSIIMRNGYIHIGKFALHKYIDFVGISTVRELVG